MNAMIRNLLPGGLAVLLAACAGQATRAPGPDAGSAVEIPYSKFVLDNGLTLIVHEDHKAPIVAVNIWYHVGSKNEKEGKTGFAHLFEHLMFNGSEHYNDDYFKPFDRVGATDMNGTTDQDRTNYFQNVPVTALDMALWMESDRMGHLLGAIDQAKLDEQRGVVQNEKRQGENQPYGKVWNMILENTYPEGHPYSWSTIGSMEDLNAASLEDVQEWFKTYYGAANAVLVVAGDVDAETVKQKVEKYFGHIPAGPPLAAQDVWIARRSGEHRQYMQDRVPQARVVKVWNVPQLGSEAGDYLTIAADILGGGKSSRLYQRLVYKEQVATDVVAFPWLREIGGSFIVWATAQPGQDLAEVERMLDDELQKFLREGPTAQELQRMKTVQRAAFVRGIERIGGFGGKSDILASNEIYLDNPEAWKITQARVQGATRSDVRAAAREWLDDGAYVLEVNPYPEYAVKPSGVDRGKGIPPVASFPRVDFPEMQKATLSNGMKVILAQRDTVPVVNMDLWLDAGFAADQFGKPGTARLAMDMLDEGTRNRSALQISEELAQLGAQLWSGGNLDMSDVGLSVLKENLTPALEIYADVIMNPTFPPAELERLRKQQLAAIQREKVTPVQMALRVFPRLLYGEAHAYGLPLTGSGTEKSIKEMTRDELAGFHATWFKPNNATLVVVGDVTLAELVPQLERRFAAWQPGETPAKNIAPVTQQETSTVYIVDRPGSIQSIIFAGHVVPPKNNPDEIAIQAMNAVLGGSFSARLNMNLREDKHWAYGAYTFMWDARGQRPFVAYAPVQSDKTAESMLEVLKEIGNITDERPPALDEVARAKDEATLTLPGRWETGNAVLADIVEVVQFNLPENYWDEYPEKMRSLSVRDVSRVAGEVVQPRKLVWVVVGDREVIEPEIREAGFTNIKQVDADGNLVGQ